MRESNSTGGGSPLGGLTVTRAAAAPEPVLDEALLESLGTDHRPHEGAGESSLSELLRIIEEPEDEMSFATVEDLAEQEDFETLGRWVKCPIWPGSEFLIAHLSACSEKRDALEERVRREKKIKPGEPLTQNSAAEAKLSEGMFRAAMFGTVVKDWRKVPSRNGEFPFSERNYKLLMSKRRFRLFVLRESKKTQDYREVATESVKGNS